jgi:hypothetical protein
MKKGKSCVIKGYKQIKCSYGTVDSKNLKSIYLNIQSWVEPKTLENSWVRSVSVFTKNVKNSISEIINKDLYSDKFIVDLDLRTSGLALRKRSFMNLEVTFYIKKDMDFKSSEIKSTIKEIISYLEKEVFYQSKYFKFYLTKNDKVKNTDKIEIV